MLTKQRVETLRGSIFGTVLKSVRHHPYLLITLLSVALIDTVFAETPFQTAKGLVTAQTCTNGESVDEVLDHKKRPSRRDLGWRVFETEDGYIVERAFMVSKSMEVRYRWHVNTQGGIYPDNSRTENLCS
ncbi:MAG: hypothetical protein ACU836_04160 [Gammaproteobacteria bacterium]